MVTTFMAVHSYEPVFQIVYIIPGDDYTGSWISVSVGTICCTMMALANPSLEKHHCKLTNRYVKYILVEIYNVLTTVCVVLFWKGGNVHCLNTCTCYNFTEFYIDCFTNFLNQTFDQQAGVSWITHWVSELRTTL